MMRAVMYSRSMVHTMSRMRSAYAMAALRSSAMMRPGVTAVPRPQERQDENTENADPE